MTRTTTSVEETLMLAHSFARRLRRGDVVALYGELGSGKTHFVKGVCNFFRVREHITSPTFVLLNRYGGADDAGNELLIFHFDLYRVKSIQEIYDLGYEEFFHSDGICLIEWAEQMDGLLAENRHDVRLGFGSDERERIIEISGHVDSSKQTPSNVHSAQ